MSLWAYFKSFVHCAKKRTGAGRAGQSLTTTITTTTTKWPLNSNEKEVHTPVLLALVWAERCRPPLSPVRLGATYVSEIITRLLYSHTTEFPNVSSVPRGEKREQTFSTTALQISGGGWGWRGRGGVEEEEEEEGTLGESRAGRVAAYSWENLVWAGVIIVNENEKTKTETSSEETILLSEIKIKTTVKKPRELQ